MVSPSCFIIRNFRNDGNFRNEYSNTNQTNSHELNIREDSGNSCSLLFLLAVLVSELHNKSLARAEEPS